MYSSETKCMITFSICKFQNYTLFADSCTWMNYIHNIIRLMHVTRIHKKRGILQSVSSRSSFYAEHGTVLTYLAVENPIAWHYRYDPVFQL